MAKQNEIFVDVSNKESILVTDSENGSFITLIQNTGDLRASAEHHHNFNDIYLEINPLQLIEDECGLLEIEDTYDDATATVGEHMLESFDEQSIHTAIENATFDSNDQGVPNEINFQLLNDRIDY